jgi:hypothetical protein
MTETREINPNKLNIYTCEECGEHIVTKDVTEGVTPFMISCQCTVGCRGKMQSSMYRVFDPDGRMKHSHEWYRPSVFHHMSPAVRAHVERGGLLIRARVDSKANLDATSTFTHIHVKRGSKYRVLFEATLQVADSTILKDGHRLVIYEGEDGSQWARDKFEFEDGRFRRIN